MDTQIVQALINYIGKININQDKKNLVVLKGFFKENLQSLPLPKLTDSSLDVTVQQLIDSKPQILLQVFARISSQASTIYWCTFEEYLLLEEIVPMYFNIKLINNNIFYKTYPSVYDIREADYIIDYFKSDNYSSGDTTQAQCLKKVQEIYGAVRRINNSLYITYSREAKASEDNLFPDYSFDIAGGEADMHDESILELTEDDDIFIELIDLLLKGKMSKRIIKFAYSTDLISEVNNYKSRIALLKALLSPSKQFYIFTKVTVSKPAFDEQKYIDILQRYWGHTSFRKLKMYKNINNSQNYNEIIEVSQAEIINDIVVQAEKSLTSDEENPDFQDIFVTSPTGAGKSIMFQIPAIYLAEKHQAMTIVISPLIGLMVDQVEGLQNKNITMAATINSEITPVEKIEIMNKIRNYEISILYISPETLLSRSDIVDLIGERQIGLFVIDEAHIVTTWGKSFRADYWYLGGYLQKLRNKKKQNIDSAIKRNTNFPIATFTATAIYSGPEDMYKETRDSLNLKSPIKYFGYVKRDDIEVKLKKSKNNDNSKEKNSEYREKKFTITMKRLESLLAKKKKTLVYFPTVSLIQNFLGFVKLYGSTKLQNNIAIYHGQLDKINKNESYLKYKNSDALIMLATKAFGMGIDIPDIAVVYHFAPTGNVCDYVQEIGRAARSLDKGYAFFDFLSRDFTHVNKLHGISTLRKTQLVQMIEKILNIYIKNGENRNLLISTEEFRHIFTNGNSEDTDIDNKVKTSLLVIEKDFERYMKFSPLVGRPRSIFTTDYFVVPYEHEVSIKRAISTFINVYSDNNNNFNDIGKIYCCDMKALWEANYKNLSFAQFKYKFYTHPEELKLYAVAKVIPVIRMALELKANNYNEFTFRLKKILSALENILGNYSTDKHYFTEIEYAESLQKALKENKYYCENLVGVVLNCIQYYQRIQKLKNNFYKPFMIYRETSDNEGKYSIQNSSYPDFFQWITEKIDYLIRNAKLDTSTNVYKFYIAKPKDDKSYLEQVFIVLGIIETMGLALYETNGGDNPQIYIRINSKMQLEGVVNAPDKYDNQILNNVRNRHKISVSILKYIFENELDTESFWQLIEDYFLGRLPERILK